MSEVDEPPDHDPDPDPKPPNNIDDVIGFDTYDHSQRPESLYGRMTI